MTTLTRTTDGQARVILPSEFANSTVQIEQLSETELLIRKTPAADEDRFSEETPRILSDRDRDLFLELLDNPPRANDALKRAAAKSEAGHG